MDDKNSQESEHIPMYMTRGKKTITFILMTFVGIIVGLICGTLLFMLFPPLFIVGFGGGMLFCIGWAVKHTKRDLNAPEFIQKGEQQDRIAISFWKHLFLLPIRLIKIVFYALDAVITAALIALLPALFLGPIALIFSLPLGIIVAIGLRAIKTARKKQTKELLKIKQIFSQPEYLNDKDQHLYTKLVTGTPLSPMEENRCKEILGYVFVKMEAPSTAEKIL